MTIDVQHENDPIRIAVEREARRRKRVLLGFLALLLVPLAIGGWALAKAPSETEAVAREVTPIVQQSVGENVTKQVVAESRALIEENVNRSVEAKIEAKIEPIKSLHAEVATLNREVARMQPALLENVRLVADVRSQVAKLPRRDPTQIEIPPDRELAAIRAQMEKQQNDLALIMRRLTFIEKRLQIQR
jgi:hypothetical protein